MLPELIAPRWRQTISLTPLIDVVFILLLFFMLSSSFMQWRQIDLPAPVATDSEPEKLLRVRLLDNAGQLEIDGRAYTLADAETLQALVSSQPDPIYAIETAEGVSTQSLISLVDGLKRAGVEKVSLSGVLP